MSHSHKKTPSQRQLKVGETLRHAISDTFMREDFYNEETGKPMSITVSEVSISPDLRNATIYVMPLGGEDRDTAIKSLSSIASKVRGLVSQKVKLRHMPMFTFKLDTLFDQLNDMETLFKKPEVQRDLKEESFATE